jgi:hypothetical protein
MGSDDDENYCGEPGMSKERLQQLKQTGII